MKVEKFCLSVSVLFVITNFLSAQVIDDPIFSIQDLSFREPLTKIWFSI